MRNPRSATSSVPSGARGLVLAAAWLVLGPDPAGAATRVIISVVPSMEATVTLTSTATGRGTSVVVRGDASVEVDGGGTYTVTVAFLDRTERTSIDLPDSGSVQLVVDPATTPAIRYFALAVEEVTVTAERVESNLQRVPVAVTVVTSRELETAGLRNIQAVSYQTPNLWMETNTGLPSGSRAAIRGIGEDESFFTSDTPVGIYIDDVYIPRQNGAQFDLFDIERVEVLRGPQGTLYGRNTSAGALKLITRQPGNLFMANGEVTFGSYGRADLRGGVTMPLAGGKTSVQISALKRSLDGYDINTVNGRRVNDQNTWGARASIRMVPARLVDLLVVGDYLEDNSQPGTALGLVPQPPLVNGVGMGRPDLSAQVDGDRDVSTRRSDLLDPVHNLLQKGIAATLTVPLSPALAVKSVTAYRTMYNLLLLDADGQVGNNFVPPIFPQTFVTFHLFQDQRQKQWSQELQASGALGSRVRYLVGYYRFDETNSQSTENIALRPQQVRGGNYTVVDLSTASNAVYGNVTLQPASRLSVSVGGRYTHDAKDYAHRLFRATGAPYTACFAPDGSLLAPPNGRACLPTDPAGSAERPIERFLVPDFSGFTPRFAVDYAMTADQMVYFSAARGFKSGAFDGRNTTPSAIPFLQPITEETLWSYEGGIKSDLFGNRVRLNLAAFYNDWKNLQGSGTDQQGNFRRFNIGDVRTKGLEIEARSVLARGLELSGQLSVLRTDFVKVNFNQAVDCAPYGTGTADLELKYSPHQSYSLGVTYAVPRAVAGGTVTFVGSLAGKTGFFHTACNALAGSEDGYTIASIVAAYETRDGRLRFSLAGENITDERYITGSFTFGAPLRFQSVYLSPPRRLVASVRYAFRQRP